MNAFSWLAIGTGVLALGALAIASMSETEVPMPDSKQATGNWPTVLYVGRRGDPELESLLQQLDDELRSAGVRSFTAAEVTKMRKTQGPSFAVPARGAWPRMVQTLAFLQRIRDDVGKPIRIYNGYRPPDYNKAVGGARNSQHQGFRAVDTITDDMERYALLIAKYYVLYGADEKMGFGVYRKGTRLTGVHIDTGFRRRTWGAADDFVERAQAVA